MNGRDLHIEGRRRGRAKRPFDGRAMVDWMLTQFFRKVRQWEVDAPTLAEVRDLTVQGADGPLPARLYTPFAAGVMSPGLVFLHGGGFMVCDLDSHDMMCRRIADAGRLRVLSVAYRLAPAHRWPAAPNDAIAATRWAHAHAREVGFEADRIGVGGDSAGGNLAAVTAQALKDDPDIRLRAQALIYPCTQFLKMTPSQVRVKEAYHVTQAVQDFFIRQYLGDREAVYDWRASPLVRDDLAGLPPAYVVTAGLDPLQDEGRAYADKLAANGVPVTYRPYQSQVHGFFSLSALSQSSREAIAACGQWLAKTLSA